MIVVVFVALHVNPVVFGLVIGIEIPSPICVMQCHREVVREVAVHQGLDVDVGAIAVSHVIIVGGTNLGIAQRCRQEVPVIVEFVAPIVVGMGAVVGVVESDTHGGVDERAWVGAGGLQQHGVFVDKDVDVGRRHMGYARGLAVVEDAGGAAVVDR